MDREPLREILGKEISTMHKAKSGLLAELMQKAIELAGPQASFIQTKAIGPFIHIRQGDNVLNLDWVIEKKAFDGELTNLFSETKIKLKDITPDEAETLSHFVKNPHTINRAITLWCDFDRSIQLYLNDLEEKCQAESDFDSLTVDDLGGTYLHLKDGRTLELFAIGDWDYHVGRDPRDGSLHQVRENDILRIESLKP